MLCKNQIKCLYVRKKIDIEYWKIEIISLLGSRFIGIFFLLNVSLMLENYFSIDYFSFFVKKWLRDFQETLSLALFSPERKAKGKLDWSERKVPGQRKLNPKEQILLWSLLHHHWASQQFGSTWVHGTERGALLKSFIHRIPEHYQGCVFKVCWMEPYIFCCSALGTTLSGEGVRS